MEKLIYVGVALIAMASVGCDEAEDDTYDTYEYEYTTPSYSSPSYSSSPEYSYCSEEQKAAFITLQEHHEGIKLLKEQKDTLDPEYLEEMAQTHALEIFKTCKTSGLDQIASNCTTNVIGNRQEYIIADKIREFCAVTEGIIRKLKEAADAAAANDEEEEPETNPKVST